MKKYEVKVKLKRFGMMREVIYGIQAYTETQAIANCMLFDCDEIIGVREVFKFRESKYINKV